MSIRTATVSPIGYKCWFTCRIWFCIGSATSWTVRGSNPGGDKIFRTAENGLGAQSVSYTMGTGSFLGVNRPGRGVDHPPKSSAEFNLLNPTGQVVHHQFNIQQLYALPTLYLSVLYLSENKQRLVPLTA